MKPVTLPFASHENALNGIHIFFYKSLTVFPRYHSHDYYEFFLITEGPVIHCCNKKEKELKKGTLVLIRPEDSHNYRTCRGSDFSFYNIALSRETASKLFELFNREAVEKEFLIPEDPPEAELSMKNFTNLKERLNRFNSVKGEQERVFYATGLAAELLACLPPEKETKEIPHWFSVLLSQLQDKENFTGGLNTLYSLAGRSREHITRCFKKYLNITPTRYLNSLKLNYACNLLGSTNLEIIDISEESGFENLSHFYHLFKENFGLSPGKYRNLNSPHSLWT